MATAKTTKEKAVEAGAKAPADRAAKAEARDELVAMTVAGIEITVNPRAARNWEALEEAQVNDNPFPLLNGILGAHKAEILDALRGDDGIVDARDVRSTLGDIMKELGMGNSSPSPA